MGMLVCYSCFLFKLTTAPWRYKMQRIDKNNQIVSKEILTLITRENWSIRLLTELEKSFNIVFFGGAVRDILYGHGQQIRDIDLVLYPKRKSDMDRQDELLKKAVEDICGDSYYYNQFHGYKIKGKTNLMDLWLLKDTWAFQRELLPVSLPNLLQSVYLNIDAYAWHYNERKFVSHCDVRDINIIDIVLEKNACEWLNLIRAVVFSSKYGINLSDFIIKKLYLMLEEWPSIEREVFSIEQRHYGKIAVTEKDIKNLIEKQGRGL